MTAAIEEAQYSVEKVRLQALNLFLVGFLVLFLELACIRWFAAYVVFLQFFTNVVLIASFLGMSCGCLAARARLFSSSRVGNRYSRCCYVRCVPLLERLIH